MPTDAVSKHRASPRPSSDVALSLRAQVARIRRVHASAHTEAEFLRTLSGALCGPRFAQQVIVRWSEGDDLLTADGHAPGFDPAFWRADLLALTDRSASDGRAHQRTFGAKDNAKRVTLTAAPVVRTSGSAVIAFVEEGPTDDALERAAAAAEAISLALESFEPEHTDAEADEREADMQRGLLDAIGAGESAESLTEFAYAIVNGLRTRLHVDHVAMGRVTPRRVHLMAVSGYAQVKTTSVTVRHIAGSMAECADLGESTISSRRDEDRVKPLQPRVLTAWQRHCGADVACFPLVSGDRTIGVIGIQHRPGVPFSPDKLKQIEEALGPLAASMSLVARATESWITRLTRTIVASLDPRRTVVLVRAGALAACTAALLWFVFGTLTHRVAAGFTVAPSITHVMTAETPAVLSELLVRPGDHVEVGDVLATLDDPALRTEIAAIGSQLAVKRAEASAALAEGDAALWAVRSAESTGLQIELAELRRREEALAVRSPVSGVVSRDDGASFIGQAVPAGHPLVEVVPLEDVELRILVPNSQIAHVEPGLTGDFASTASPERRRAMRVHAVRPVAQPGPGSPAFEVIATVEGGDPEGLLPGVEGVARIEAGRKRVWWIVLRPVLDKLRLNGWM